MRTWAQCSETAFLGNIHAVQKMLRKTRLLGIVKANAYGHGAVQAAKLLVQEGAAMLAVATLSEAIELRNAGISHTILILGPTEPTFFSDLIEYDLTQAIADLGYAKRYSSAAKWLNKTLKCHLKLDTGMGRLGFTEPSDAVRATSLNGLEFEGVFAHFAVSDVADGEEYTLAQLEKFKGLVRDIEQGSGVEFRLKHMANSGGIESFPQSHLDIARPGIVLYGYPATGANADIRPVMELKTRIVQVKQLNKGDSVSYGRRFVAAEPTTIAVLPIGYADGLSRSLTGRLKVLVGGKVAQQIGTICMDMCMIDVTDVKGVQAGDIVTVFGREKGFTAQDMAELRGTIPYEVLCNVAARVPRVWAE